MKKIIILLFTAIFGLAIFSSCKTADCPAYSKATNENIEQPA